MFPWLHASGADEAILMMRPTSLPSRTQENHEQRNQTIATAERILKN